MVCDPGCIQIEPFGVAKAFFEIKKSHIGVKLFPMSKVQWVLCKLCLKICTTEGRQGKKNGGWANFKIKYPEPLGS